MRFSLSNFLYPIRRETSRWVAAFSWLSRVACAAGLSASPLASAATFDQAFIDSQLPIGCTAHPEVDSLGDDPPPPPYPPRGRLLGTILQIDARNQITCREEVPEAIWPNPSVPRPKWPEPPVQPRPQDFDLKNAKPEAGDKVVSAYFDHLCESASGEFVYRKVEDPQPVSLINLRPRPVYLSNSKIYDMFWIQAIDSYLEDKPIVEDDYKGGGRQYSLASSERGQDPKTRAWKPWHIIGDLGPEGYLINNRYLTKTGEEFPLKDWVAYNVRRSDAPLFFERPMNAEERKQYPGYSLIRYEYSPLPQPRKRVTLVNDEEVFMIPRPVDPRPPMNCRDYDDRCKIDYNEGYVLQKRIVTPTNESKAQYGYMWREITHSPEDLRLGVTGSEMMVVDMRTGETIAVRRSYTRRYVEKKPFTVVWNMRRAVRSTICLEPVPREFGSFIGDSVGLRKR